MSAIENLKNVFDWKSSENQSSHGITTPVNGVIDWSSFPVGFEHWITRGQTSLRVVSTGTTVYSNSTKTDFTTNNDSQYGEFKTWVDSLGLKSYSASVPLESKFYLPFGNVKLEIHCDHNPYNILQNSVYTNQFKNYISDVTMFTLETDTFDFSSNEYTSVSVGFIATTSVFGFAIVCENTERKKIKAYIHEIELNEAFKTALGTDYTNGFTYEDDPNYGSGGVAQGLTGIVDTLSDDVNVPLKSNKGVTSTGFINLYEITNNTLVDFGKDMFSDIDINFNGMTSDEWLAIMNDSSTKLSQIPEEDRPQASEWFANTFNASYGISDLFKLGKQVAKNFFNSMLIKYVLSVHIIPVEPTTTANAERINVGFKQFNQTAKRITSDYVDFDYGTLAIPSKYKNFLDYSYTHCKIFIPFTGFVDIDPKYVYDQTIGLKTRFNVIDGTCVTFLTTTGLTGNTSVIGTYNGSCCVHLPFTGENYSNMISGVISGVGGVVSGVATSNPMLAIGGGINGMSSVANGLGGTLLGSPQTSASASFMGMRTPYIIIERPIPQLPPRYFSDHGGLANIVEKPINCNGYTRCSDVVLPTTVKSDIATKLKEIMESGFIV